VYLARKDAVAGIRFVMDTIERSADKEGKRQRKLIGAQFGAINGGVADTDLLKPWLDALQKANTVAVQEGNDRQHRDLKRIEDHVAKTFRKHRDTVNKAHETARKKQKTPKKGSKVSSSSFTDLGIEGNKFTDNENNLMILIYLMNQQFGRTFFVNSQKSSSQ
jgi:hypothetical protein